MIVDARTSHKGRTDPPGSGHRTYGMLVGGCCAVVLSLVMVSPRVASADTGTMTAVEQQHLDDLTPVGVRELAPAGDGW